jgi:hypothetical protein
MNFVCLFQIALYASLWLASPSFAIPFFKFNNLTYDTNLQPSTNGVLVAIRNRAGNLSDAEIVKAAQHGQLGACTYSDAVGPISNFVWGFIKVGDQRSQDNQLALAGPKRNGTKPISGIVYKQGSIRRLLRPGIRDFYGGMETSSREAQVAIALRNLANDATDPCKLETYAAKVAAEINRLNSVARNLNNVVHKSSGGSILPGDCALRVSKVPVSNLSLFLDNSSSSGGCAFVLRRLPARFCKFIYVNDRPQIKGARLLTGSRFDASVGLSNTINGLPSDKLALLTHSVPERVGVKALLDLDIENLSISNWVDPRTESLCSNTCAISPLDPSYDQMRRCSFSGGEDCPTSCSPLSGEVRMILKLWYEHGNKSPGDASGATPLSAVGTSSKLKAMLDYYSGVTGGGPGGSGSNLLSADMAGFETGTLVAVGTPKVPKVAAFSPRRIPLDRLQDVANIELDGADNLVLKDINNQTLTLPPINCDSIPSADEPGPIDLLSDTYAPAPVAPINAGPTWAPASTNLSPALVTGGLCPLPCACGGFGGTTGGGTTGGGTTGGGTTGGGTTGGGTTGGGTTGGGSGGGGGFSIGGGGGGSL